MKLTIRILIYPLIVLMFVILTSSSSENDPSKDEKASNDPASTNGTVKDSDGNVYKTVTIGMQVWMAENLKTTKFRNGKPIPCVQKNSTWADITMGAYSWYNNDASANKGDYGVLYNWYAVNDSRNIAPAGWHIPSEAEWTILTTYLKGKGLAGGKLKETLTSHWASPNSDATNSSGFTALPGGYRNKDGDFRNVNIMGGWWTITEYTKSVAWYRYVDCNSSNIYICSTFKNSGFSVRCIKD